MQKIQIMLSLGIALALSGCATLDRADCLNADWRTLGFEDGVKGRNQSQISQYRQDCAEHGVTPDLNAYRQGHIEGAVQFCTAQNGFRQGMQNNTYQNSCPADLEAAFMTGYRDGQLVYEARSRVDNAQSEQKKLGRYIDEHEKNIKQLNEQLVADGLSREQRVKVRDKLAAHNENLGQAKLRYAELTAAIIILQRDLDRVRASMSHY